MKQQLKFNLMLLFLIGVISAFAGDQEEKKKYVEKSYKVSSTTKLNIKNKFGNIKIHSWEKNEFAIKVEIIAKSRSSERAQRLLDEISIDILESKQEIAFETEVENTKNKNQEGFEVHYEIYMPEQNPLEVKNSFGDIVMGDRSGDLTLEVNYGSARVGKVAGDAQLKVSFGSGSIEKIVKGDVTIKYSKFEIEEAGQLDLTQGFSDVEIGEVKDLELESRYGKVEIGEVDILDAEAHFSDFEIELLRGSLELECSYLGDFTIDRVAKTFTLIDIDGRFGSYEIGLEEGLNADIDAEFSFADIKVSSDVQVTFNYQVKESNKKIYRGKIGKGDPNKLIRIDSSYGNLRLQMD